jgi:hypothetical protein
MWMNGGSWFKYFCFKVLRFSGTGGFLLQDLVRRMLSQRVIHAHPFDSRLTSYAFPCVLELPPAVHAIPEYGFARTTRHTASTWSARSPSASAGTTPLRSAHAGGRPPRLVQPDLPSPSLTRASSLLSKPYKPHSYIN